MENNSNKLRYWTPILVGIALAMGIFFGRKMTSAINPFAAQTSSNTTASAQKIQDILDIVDQYYVDSVNREELLEKTITDMLHELDPHSNYISAKDLQLMNEQIKGEFFGVGVRFFIIRDTICITNVIPNSPSERAGVKAGDKIISVNGKKIAGVGVKNEDVMSSLKGKANTEVKVELKRGESVVKTSIVRGSIPIHSVIASFMLTPEIGFVKIDQFSVTTDKEFKVAVQNLRAQGMKKIILDLRNNAGGVMQTSTNVVDEFLAANKIIVSTKGNNSKERIYRATANGMLENMPTVVLINENSASASEIVAGALQDNDRATIIGRRSFGKGLVQEDMKLRDNSSLRLTIARYYTPTGRSIQKPYNGSMEDYYHEKNDRLDNGELYAPDSSLFVDSLKYKTPKGKVVYGGGGIMPDVFIPLDTTGTSWLLTQLRYTMAFQAFAFDFANGKYDKWKNPSDFDKNFVVTDAIIQQFIRFSEKEFKVKPNAADLKTSKELIRLLLKAEIARQIWTENGYFKVISSDDKELIKAVKVLNSTK